MEKWKETRDYLYLESRRVEQPVKETEDTVKLTARIPGQWNIVQLVSRTNRGKTGDIL